MTRMAWALLALLCCVAQAQPKPQPLLPPVGRLLLDPADRLRLQQARIDAVAASRQPQVPGMAQAGASAAYVAPSSAPTSHSVQGWVMRKGGRSTVWVDGTPYYGFDAQSTTQNQLLQHGVLQRHGPDNPVLRGRPGQTIGAGAAQRDIVPEGAVRIGPPAAAASHAR